MSKGSDAPASSCQIVRSLDAVGEKWSLLIVRNALRGQTRFSQFRDELGIPTDILTARLASLVASGILEKRLYREPGSRERSSYHLTERGRGLKIVMAAFMQWNDEFAPAPEGKASIMTEADSGEPVELCWIGSDGEKFTTDEVAVAPGPAATKFWDALT